MRRVCTLTLFAMLVIAPLLAAQPVTAQTNGEALCAQAAETGSVRGYDVVYGHGGSGNQVVLGSDDADTLRGGTGNDILCGFGGDDTLRGGSGNDILVGGNGEDELFGQSGNDTLYGDPSDTVLNEGNGNDQTIMPPPPEITYVVYPPTGDSCEISFTMSGFEPEISFSATFFFSPESEYLTKGISDRTDASGDFSFGPESSLTLELGASVTLVRVYADSTILAENPSQQTCNAP